METPANQCLIAAFRANWRVWLPFWVVEGVWAALGFASSFGLELPSAALWVLAPFFFVTFFRATAPYMRSQVTFWQQTFWVMLAPFAVVLVLFAFRWGVEVARAV